jgi:hypothetical protein
MSDPAFPTELEQPNTSSDPLATPKRKEYSGLTKLEYAAIEAMKGILAGYVMTNGGGIPDQTLLAADSISCAKALLSKLEEEK